MKTSIAGVSRFSSSWPIIILLLAVSTIILGTVLLLHFWKGIPIGHLTRDPAAIAKTPIYTGIVSQVGLFIWSASVAICLFCFRVLSKTQGDGFTIRRFLFFSGLLSLVLGLDDAFQLHEGLFPSFGVPEKAVLSVYSGFMLFYLVRFYLTILKTDFILLVMALAFFAISALFDLVKPAIVGSLLFEDSAKLVGIVTWFAYLSHTGASELYRIAVRQDVTSAVQYDLDATGEGDNH